MRNSYVTLRCKYKKMTQKDEYLMCHFFFFQKVSGPNPMQLVVVSAVMNAVSAATITFAAISRNCFLSMVSDIKVYKIEGPTHRPKALSLQVTRQRLHRPHQSLYPPAQDPPRYRDQCWLHASPLPRCGQNR